MGTLAVEPPWTKGIHTEDRLIPFPEDSEQTSIKTFSLSLIGFSSYAMERTPTSIKVWWWPRNAASIPTEVTTLHTPDINTQSWGVPFAYFDNQACDLNSKFGLHNVIINLTFCEDYLLLEVDNLTAHSSGGDWAGQQQLYSQAGCPGTCVGTFLTTIT